MFEDIKFYGNLYSTNNDDFYDRYATIMRSGDFEIKSSEVYLRQTATNGERFLKGSGFVKQTENGNFAFEINAEDGNIGLGDWMRKIAASQAGKLFSEDEYYDLELIDGEGTRWRSERILPDLTFEISGRVRAAGDLFRLHVEFDCGSGLNACALEYFTRVELPFAEMTRVAVSGKEHITRNLIRHEENGDKTNFFELDQGLLIEFSSARPLPDSIDIRLSEALRFVTGRGPQPRAIRICANGTETLIFRRRNEIYENAKLYPPLDLRGHHQAMHMLSLFRCYYNYVVSNSTGRDWNIVSFYIATALEGTTNQIQLRSASLGIAVEGLVGLLEVPNPHDVEALTELRSSVLKQIREDSSKSKYADRIQGLLGRLTDLSVPDRLRWLVEQRHTPRENANAWGKLRNKYVHPQSSNFDPEDPLKLQSNIDLLLKVTVLMYHVVFILIGYRGVYTDYGKYGFPLATLPVSDPEAAPEK